MDDDARDRIIRDIDPELGIRSEMEKVMGYSPTDEQQKAINQRVDFDMERKTTTKVHENGEWRIKAGQSDVKSVISSKYISYSPRTGREYIKDPETGRYKRVLD